MPPDAALTAGDAAAGLRAPSPVRPPRIASPSRLAAASHCTTLRLRQRPRPPRSLHDEHLLKAASPPAPRPEARASPSPPCSPEQLSEPPSAPPRPTRHGPLAILPTGRFAGW